MFQQSLFFYSVCYALIGLAAPDIANSIKTWIDLELDQTVHEEKAIKFLLHALWPLPLAGLIFGILFIVVMIICGVLTGFFALCFKGDDPTT